MKKISTLLIFLSLALFSQTVQAQAYTIGNPIIGDTLYEEAYEGYLTAGKTYYVAGNVTINASDTLIVEQGVKLYLLGNYGFIVKGSLISLGTQANPVWFTVQDITKEDNISTDPLTDPAYQGHWLGFQCDTSFTHLIFKWTHIEYAGGLLGTAPVTGLRNGSQSWPIFTNNPNGIFVMEDSWLYGSNDDAMRISGGKIHIMRNTFEKLGLDGADCINMKSGTVGNVAYNLVIGSATNGIKASQSGSNNPQTDVVIYNNTILNSGYRQEELGRGGSIDYEDQAEGLAYNNMIVDCKYGLRIVGVTTSYEGNSLIAADTANIHYGNTLTYCDSADQAQQIYPIGLYTKPQPTDIPNPSLFIPIGYQPGDSLTGAQVTPVVHVDNPKFVNYPLPQPNFQSIAYATGWDFRLQTGSPAIGAGYTGFSPLSVVPLDAVYGACEVTPPGVDIGAFQSNGTGNQHYSASAPSCNYPAGVTAVTSAQSTMPVQVYPNPAQSDLYVSVPSAAGFSLSLVNMIGNEVATAISGGTSYTLPVASLPNGIYMLQINSNGQNSFQKIVVSK